MRFWNESYYYSTLVQKGMNLHEKLLAFNTSTTNLRSVCHFYVSMSLHQYLNKNHCLIFLHNFPPVHSFAEYHSLPQVMCEAQVFCLLCVPVLGSANMTYTANITGSAKHSHHS